MDHRTKELRQLKRFRADAARCVVISKLATDKVKRETFARLAARLRQMATDIEAVLATKKIADGQTSLK